MNKHKVSKLTEEMANFALSKVKEANFNPVEVAQALGGAIAIVIAYPLLKRLKELGELPPEDEEDEEDEEEEGGFRYQSQAEKAYAFQRLSSKYPHKIVCEIGLGNLEVPKWLQKEIVERRG